MMHLRIDAGKQAPTTDIDPFSRDYIADPYPQHHVLREIGATIWLEKYECWCVPRYAEAHAIVSDWKTFCSSAGVGLANFRKEKPWRPPSLLLEADPPDHTKRRAVMGRVLSPANIKRLRERFEREATAIVDRIIDAGPVDGHLDIAKAYTLKVFPDAVGLAPDGRDNLLIYGTMVFNAFGVLNDIFRESAKDAESVGAWIMERCRREALDKAGLGEQLFQAADAGEITHDEAVLLVRSLLSAGVDTTIDLVGNVIYCFAKHPGEWAKLRQDPTRARASIEEVLRFESPFQGAFRTTTRKVEVGGVTMGDNDKVFVLLGSSNRDPRRWERPDVFDIDRRTTGQVAFGTGIHGCVGQMISRLEVECLLIELARRVERIELLSEGPRKVHNTLRGFVEMPVRFLSA
jgi:4-methoxybenzoate monooxygenase (O-demethylating)